MSEESPNAERMVADVEALCGFEGRRPGTDAERRAANHLARRLRELGWRADVEATYVHPQAALIWAAHCALGFAASVIALPLPPVGFALALVAAASLYLDLNTRLYLLRTLFFRRGSQNVVARGRSREAPARLLIVAHYDVARTGQLFFGRSLERATRATRLFGFDPPRIPFWSLALLVPILGARVAGLDSAAIGAIQVLPTLALLVAGFALLDIEYSPASPGANDNASGVAVALALASELRANPPANLDPWVVLTGGGESPMEGMRAFLRAHRDELDRRRTFVIALDAVGRGELRYVASEGLAVAYPADARLLELAQAVAETGDVPAAPERSGFAGEALAARVRGLRALELTAAEPGDALPSHYHLPTDTPEHIDPDALTRARDFALALVRALDRDVGRELDPERPGAQRPNRVGAADRTRP
ncbi:MAG TPA: M28 family peptidase [Solirubrobacterales bacterium]